MYLYIFLSNTSNFSKGVTYISEGWEKNGYLKNISQKNLRNFEKSYLAEFLRDILYSGDLLKMLFLVFGVYYILKRIYGIDIFLIVFQNFVINYFCDIFICVEE